MHELALVKKIIESAEKAAKANNIKKVSVLRMRIGKMAGFAPDQLTFLFDTYEKDPCLDGTKLEVEEVEVELECPECKHAFIDKRFNDHDFAHTVSHAPIAYEAPSCPKCNANGPCIIHGKELDMINLDGE